MNSQYSATDNERFMPSILRSLPFIFGIWLTSLSCDLQAQTSIDDVMPLLEGYEWRLEPEPFVCMGEGVDVALRAIAADSNLANYYRMRAISALSLFSNPETASFLEQVIADDGSHPSRVQQALYAYSDAFAQKLPERVTEVARNALAADLDYQIQSAAAMTLAKLRTPEAKAALHDYSRSDMSDLQQQQITRAMQAPDPVKAAGRRSGSVKDSKLSADYNCT